MDTARALARAEEFLVIIENSLREDVSGTYTAVDPAEDEEIRRLLPLLQRIANAVEPKLGEGMAPYSIVGEWPWSNARSATLHLIGLLSTKQEADEIVAPIGPRLEAAELHPTIWGAAAKLWDDGHLRLAVQTAATFLEKHLQAKLSVVRPGGYELVTLAFNPNPKAGATVLRFPGFVEGSDDWTSAHQGAMAFAQGCMLRIRNLATHRPVEPAPQVALEELAALSVLARWIDEAQVVTI